MGQPTDNGAPTPGSKESGIPLVQGVDPKWNDVLQHIPEDKRAEVTPKLQEYDKQYSELAPWQEFQKSGIDPQTAETAVNVLAALEHQPQMVYEQLGKHLGISTQEVQEVMEEEPESTETESTSGVDPNIQQKLDTLEKQFNTLAQIALAQKQEQEQSAEAKEQDKAIENELSVLKKQYGDFPEDEILMRMLHKEMSAEDAYKEYASRTEEIRKRRPAPQLLGGGGQVPQGGIDPKKLSGKETKSLVAQMLSQASQEG